MHLMVLLTWGGRVGLHHTLKDTDKYFPVVSFILILIQYKPVRSMHLMVLLRHTLKDTDKYLTSLCLSSFSYWYNNKKVMEHTLIAHTKYIYKLK